MFLHRSSVHIYEQIYSSDKFVDYKSRVTNHALQITCNVQMFFTLGLDVKFIEQVNAHEDQVVYVLY